MVKSRHFIMNDTMIIILEILRFYGTFNFRHCSYKEVVGICLILGFPFSSCVYWSISKVTSPPFKVFLWSSIVLLLISIDVSVTSTEWLSVGAIAFDPISGPDERNSSVMFCGFRFFTELNLTGTWWFRFWSRYFWLSSFSIRRLPRISKVTVSLWNRGFFVEIADGTTSSSVRWIGGSVSEIDPEIEIIEKLNHTKFKIVMRNV